MSEPIVEAKEDVKREYLRRATVIRTIHNELQNWQANDKGMFKNTTMPQLIVSSAIYEDGPRKYRSFTHEWLSWLTRHPAFEAFLLCVIAANAIVIAIDSSTEDGSWGNDLVTADIIFLTIFLVEFFVKFACEPLLYWTSPSNLFDFAIVAVSVWQFFNTFFRVDSVDLTYVRILRALRALRALRSVNFIRRLRILLTALIKTFGAIGNLILCLLLIMFVFACIGVFAFGPQESESDEFRELAADWGTLDRAMYSLWCLCTADGWTIFYDRLVTRGTVGAEFYFVVFILIGNFIFTNLFIGIILMNLEAAQEADTIIQSLVKDSLVSIKKGILRSIQEEQFSSLDKTDARVPLDRVIEELSTKLQKDDDVPMSHPICNPMWMGYYIKTLHQQESSLFRIQQLYFDIAFSLADIADTRYAQTSM